MSMQVPGGGGIRPLQPPTTQPPISRPGQQPAQPQVDQPPATGGRAGPQLHGINQFSSEPVSPELAQMNSWLQSHQQAAPPAPPLPRSHPPMPPMHPHETMAMQGMDHMARDLGIPPAAAHDFGRGIDQDRSRLMSLADQIGIPREQAMDFLKGMQRTGRQMDIPPDRMQAMMEHRSSETDTRLMEVMREEAGQLGIPPRRFMAMGNALMNNDKAFYMQLGQRAGLQPDQLEQLEGKIRMTFEQLEARPGIGGEKVMRMAMDDQIKTRVANAGKKLGIPPQESLRLAFTFIEEGAEGMKRFAAELKLANKADAFLQSLEQIKAQAPKEVVHRGIESFRDVKEQRHMAHQLGIDGKPMDWRTSGSDNQKPGFAFMRPMARMMRAVGDQDFNNIRHHKMEQLMEHNKKELQKFDDGKSALFSPELKAKAQQKADHLQEQNKALLSEFKKMEDAGTTPPPSKSVKIELAEQVDHLKQRIAYLTKLSSSMGDEGPMVHGPVIEDMKKNLDVAQNKLKALQG
ncbi:hypothetical protein [Parendozoicomonas haliclonae]|uniref:Uncharacterized protein n=2 Tax=Parendozoicomonas haliclonae TaxID=1960125 RepID=A0A1X7ADW7_9GAMM|nr:hypothetical protein [Parendozoicomonas haliclonae]SMA32356.1 hypothetical protein EHSB41UT_00146 [Parendozoicomonas haliclonae]